jgi:hypothetical protein
VAKFAASRPQLFPWPDKLLYAKHLQPTLGRLRLEKMQPGHVSRVLAELRLKGYAPGTISRVFAVLRSILNLERQGAGPRRPVEGRAPFFASSSDAEPVPNGRAGERPAALLAPEHKDPKRDLRLHGCPAGGGTRAHVGRLRPENGVLKVSAQLSRKKRGEPARRVPLKAAQRLLGARERDIDLHPDLVALLKRHKEEQFQKGLALAGNFVACTAEGKPLYYRNALRDLGTAADRAGLNDGDEPEVVNARSPAHRDQPLDRRRTR